MEYFWTHWTVGAEESGDMGWWIDASSKKLIVLFATIFFLFCAMVICCLNFSTTSVAWRCLRSELSTPEYGRRPSTVVPLAFLVWNNLSWWSGICVFCSDLRPSSRSLIYLLALIVNLSYSYHPPFLAVFRTTMKFKYRGYGKYGVGMSCWKRGYYLPKLAEDGHSDEVPTTALLSFEKLGIFRKNIRAGKVMNRCIVRALSSCRFSCLSLHSDCEILWGKSSWQQTSLRWGSLSNKSWWNIRNIWNPWPSATLKKTVFVQPCFLFFSRCFLSLQNTLILSAVSYAHIPTEPWTNHG